MSVYRSSTGTLGHYDEPSRGGERWDRERFERMRGRGGGSRVEHDHYRLQEHERFPGGRRDIDFHQDIDRRRPRVMERERFREEDRFARPSRSRADFLNEPTPSEIANQALAPYRRTSIVERDTDFAPRRPARPQYVRRQSSLDTFDRRPLPRYDDLERHEYRLPSNVPIPLPIRRRSPPPVFAKRSTKWRSTPSASASASPVERRRIVAKSRLSKRRAHDDEARVGPRRALHNRLRAALRHPARKQHFPNERTGARKARPGYPSVCARSRLLSSLDTRTRKR